MPEVRSLAESVVPLAPMPSSRLAVLTVPPPYLSKRQLPLLLLPPAPRPLEPGALSCTERCTERCTELPASSAGRQFARSKSAGSGSGRSRGPSSAETSLFSPNNQLNMTALRLVVVGAVRRQPTFGVFGQAADTSADFAETGGTLLLGTTAVGWEPDRSAGQTFRVWQPTRVAGRGACSRRPGYSWLLRVYLHQTLP
eukprot:scaffold15357_cov79-Phaeocystis_antarctica.AAC.2